MVLAWSASSSPASRGQAAAASGLLAEAMPTGVVFTSRSQAAMASARAVPSWAQCRGWSCGAQAWQSCWNASRASGLRPASAMELKPSSTRPATTARALPPQPSTTARWPGAVVPRRGAMKPSTSVLVPNQPPPSIGTSTFTAPSRCASGLSSRVSAATLCLWGMVTFRPRQPMASRPCTTVASCSAGAGRARNTQLRPISHRAAFCITGEREWCTGWPSTPAMAVVPERLRGGVTAAPVRQPHLAPQRACC